MEATQHLDWSAKAHKAQDKIEELRERADTWDTKVRDFARERPLSALLCAVAGGYLLARLSTWR